MNFTKLTNTQLKLNNVKHPINLTFMDEQIPNIQKSYLFVFWYQKINII